MALWYHRDMIFSPLVRINVLVQSRISDVIQLLLVSSAKILKNLKTKIFTLGMDILTIFINLQSWEDTQVEYISQKYTLEKHTEKKYTLGKYTLEN